MSNKSQKPAIRVDTPLWGEVDAADEVQEGGQDIFYVHGYSDKRIEHDSEKSDAARSGRRPDTKPMQHRFQYVSVERASGAPLKQKEQYYRARGYIPVTRENAAGLGIDVEKSGFLWGPDGTARVGSQMLMVCGASKAAAHLKDRQRRIKAMQQGVGSRLQDAADAYNRSHPGFEPTGIEIEEKNGADGTSPFDFEEKMFGKD